VEGFYGLQVASPSRDEPKSFVLCLGAGSFFVDCCSTASYVDNITGITWMPDDQFIDRNSGVSANVSSASLYYPDSSELATLKCSPDSLAKNCYSFPLTPNAIYQTRGIFFYGLYDHRSTVPSFEMVVDGTIVASINFTSRADLMAYQEVSYAPRNNLTYLCLSRDLTNSVPFISAISLVLANYQQSNLGNVMTVNIYEGFYYPTQFRWNFGGNGIIRYIHQPKLCPFQMTGDYFHFISIPICNFLK
jgi:hypothetical protein